MSDEPGKSGDTLLPLLVAFDEGLAVGCEPELAVPSELADDFGAARSVLRLLNQAWPRAESADTTVDGTAPGATPPEVPHAEPVRLGRFHVLRELGQGGFGVVYLAYDPTLARRVALKAPRSDRWRTPEFRRRFIQEGRAAALLDHPNIVRVLEADSTESSGYIASVFCEGPSLAAWLRERKGPLPCRLAAALTADLAAGVHHAHERGVVHRDLKPANVLLEIGSEKDASGSPQRITPKICDFGLAKLLEAEQTETRSGAVMGTPQYMAPEQAQGRTRDIGPAADVYSLGVLLYEMLTGRPPFVGEPGLDLLKRVATATPDRPRQRRKDVPRDLETIVLTCLEKEPSLRYASAAALETDLRRWLEGKAPLGRPEAWHRRVGRWVRRHPVWTAAAALLVLVAVGAWVAWPYLNPPPPDPDRAVKEEMAQIAGGKQATPIGEKGGPLWSRWCAGGEKATTELTPDNVFRVHTGGTSLLELLPNPGCDHYRFRAEILHENVSNNGSVGLYFGHQEYPAAPGSIHSFMQVTFDDVRSVLDQAPPEVRAQTPAPLLNPVILEAHLWSDPERGLHGWDGESIRPVSLFTAARLAGNQWRKLVVEVSPKAIQASWGNGEPVGGPLAAEEIAERFKTLLNAMDPATRPMAPAVFAAPPGLAYRGGLGLYLRFSSASFRNVAVEPLD